MATEHIRVSEEAKERLESLKASPKQPISDVVDIVLSDCRSFKKNGQRMIKCKMRDQDEQKIR